MDRVLHEASGVDGTVALLEDRILIRRRGLVASLAEKSDKEIALTDISSIEFHKAGVINGYIRFVLLDVSHHKKSLINRAKDDSAVWFRLSEQKSFETLKRAVQSKMHAGET